MIFHSGISQILIRASVCGLFPSERFISNSWVFNDRVNKSLGVRLASYFVYFIFFSRDALANLCLLNPAEVFVRRFSPGPAGRCGLTRVSCSHCQHSQHRSHLTDCVSFGWKGDILYMQNGYIYICKYIKIIKSIQFMKQADKAWVLLDVPSSFSKF